MSATQNLEEKSSSHLGQGVHFIDSGTSSREAVETARIPVEEDGRESVLLESEGECGDEYVTTDFISMPLYSLESTFERDPLELEYSYGYSCQTPNLCVVDPDTLLWYTGNIIHIFNAKSRRLNFRRSALGQDISCIVKSKSTDEFAVAENGSDTKSPVILVYRWPDFKVSSVLRGGSSSYYKSVDFSSDGFKLVSQAGPPEDTLTIWEIGQKRAIMSFQNPDNTVSKALFSPFDPDVFITCGTGHIKFWRLVETFTGLKIDSRPGRFGEVENNDVSAVCFLPEGRVLTNFCGGNLAIWKPDASLELCFSMKDLEPCHSDLITFIQIYLDDNHLYTSSLDSKVRVWNYSYITSFYNDDQQDCLHVDIDPSYERIIEDKKGHLGTPVQMLPKDDKLFPYHFYMQDKKGGIWLLDLELKKSPDAWTQLYSCHAEPIHDMSPSPGDYFLATVGCGGRMNVYSHTERTVVLSTQFADDGMSVLWLPFHVDSTGSSIVVGYRTGVLRVIVVMVKPNDGQKEQVSVVQAIKPHIAAITALTINKKGTLMVSGSEDKSIFIYGFHKNPKKVEIVPLGMVEMHGAVTDISWNYCPNPEMFLVSCDTGQVTQFVLNETNKESIKKASANQETYIMRELKTTTIQAINRGKTHKPRQYFARYTGKSLVWIEDKSARHSYHNYIYSVRGAPVAKLNISDGHTVQCAIHMLRGKYVVLGLNNGVIKVIKPSANNFSDSWQIAMHNSRNCSIKKICLSYDQKVLYSCGTDSGIFAYKVNLDGERAIPAQVMPQVEELPESIDKSLVLTLSLEEERVKEKKEVKRRKYKTAVEQFKNKLLTFLTNYYRIVQINQCLPKCLQIPKSFFRLQTKEERLLEKQIVNEKREKLLIPLKNRQMELFKKVHTIKKNFVDPIKTQKFYLFAIREPCYLKSFPERRLFSKDPLREAVDPVVAAQKAKWEKLLSGNEEQEQGPTEFERMMNKVEKKLAKEREMEIYYDHRRDPSGDDGTEPDNTNEEVPDVVTSGGSFLCDNGKFTPAEKTIFNRMNKNRLERLKCAKDMERAEKMKTGFQSYYDRVNGLLNNLIKSETKDKEKAPLVTERLHHLFNLRQHIYVHKETFNKNLRTLRQEKLTIINYYYWAQEEYKYIVEDLKHYGMDLNGIDLPEPLEVVWDIEYPDYFAFKPGTIPSDISLRMELYKTNLHKINALVPIKELIEQVKKVGVENHRLYQLIKYRKECFWNSMIVIREKLDGMITEFDKKFMPLLLERSKASLEINYLKAEYSSTLQEVDILYRYEILQTSASRYKYETVKIKHVYILRENIRKKKVSKFNDQMKECQRTIEDLNAKFMEMVKDDKWGKHLTRTYKRKYKSPKRSSSAETVLSSESTSNDDDDDDFDDDETDDDDEREEPGAAVAYIYDEAIIPPGCDEEKFRNTFKLRSQRHVEENRITEIKREKEVIMEEVKSIRKVIKICDGLLSLYYSGTFRFLKMMKDEMNDIDYLLVLDPPQIQIFDKKDPLKNVPPVEDCKLIDQSEYLLKTKTLKQLKEAIDDVSKVAEKTARCTRFQLNELRKLKEINSTRYQEIQDKFAEKYGPGVDVDVVQTFVLRMMIKSVISRATQELKEQERNEMKEAEKTNKKKHKGEALRTKRERMRTLQTLYTIEAENNRITADKMKHEKQSVTRKMDLAKERELLMKILADVEEEEEKLKAAIKDV